MRHFLNGHTPRSTPLGCPPDPLSTAPPALVMPPSCLPAAGDASEVLNERAMAVMRRMTDKLMGRDHLVAGDAGGPPGLGAVGGSAGAGPGAAITSVAIPSGSSSGSSGECDSVPAQVQRLIAQAISHENLCQSYIGAAACAARVLTNCATRVAVMTVKTSRSCCPSHVAAGRLPLLAL